MRLAQQPVPARKPQKLERRWPDSERCSTARESLARKTMASARARPRLRLDQALSSSRDAEHE